MSSLNLPTVYILFTLALCLFMVTVLRYSDSNETGFRNWCELILVGAVVTLAAYFPVILRDFVYQDDHWLWIWEYANCRSHPEYDFVFFIGRPIAMFLLCPTFVLVDSIDSAYLTRISPLIQTVLVFCLVYWVLKKLFVNDLSAVFVSGMIITSLGFHPYNYWIMATYIPFALIISLVSVILIFTVLPTIKTSNTGENLTQKTLIIRHFLTLVLLIFTLGTYQPFAGLFILMGALYVLVLSHRNPKQIKKTIWIVSSLYILSHILYYIILRLFLSRLNLEELQINYDPTNLGVLLSPSLLVEKISWFIRVPLLMSLNLVNQESISIQLFSLFTVVALLTYSCKEALTRERNSLTNRRSIILGYIFIIASIPLSFAIIILSHNSSPNFRTSTHMTLFFLSVVIICLPYVFTKLRTSKNKSAMFHFLGKQKTILVSGIFLLLLNIFNSNRILDNFSRIHASELTFIEEKLLSTDQISLNEIELINRSNPRIIAGSLHDLNAYSSTDPFHLRAMLAGAADHIGWSDRLSFVNISSQSGNNSDTSIESTNFDLITLIEEGYYQFNIVKTRGVFYAVLQGEGEFSLHRIKNEEYSIVFFSIHIAEIKQAIDRFQMMDPTSKLKLARAQYDRFSEVFNQRTSKYNRLILDMNAFQK